MNIQPMRQTGLIHLYYGEGKGKTTAAIGLIARAAGHNRRILLVQFLKDGRSGELVSLRRLPEVRILAGQVTGKFSVAMNDAEKEATYLLHLDYFHQAVRLAADGALDLLVLDEVLGAIETGLLPEEEVLAFLQEKPPALEVVLTGRRPTQNLLAMADYISEIRCVKHPYERGILAREGIEY